MDLMNSRTGNKERFSQLLVTAGKTREKVEKLYAGDIGASIKLKDTNTNDTLNDASRKSLQLESIDFPDPIFFTAIKAVESNDDEKMGLILNDFHKVDPSFRANYSRELKQLVLSGMGETHINMIKWFFDKVYKIDVEFSPVKIPYRETITSSADVDYKHKKQSGGKGQYGHVFMRIGPKGRGEGYEFINSIVGGTIPSGYIPAVEKGINETMIAGIIAGYPVVDIYCDLYYGSYHDVDSSEMAFKFASTMALKIGFAKCNPILLEPIHTLKIVIPTEYMGDVMGDISTRRGKIVGMEQEGRKQILTSELPLAEVHKYFPTLKSLTQGRGKFTQSFSHYEKVPNDEANKIIAESKQEQE